MTNRKTPPQDAIYEVVEWLVDKVDASDNPGERFYASLVIDLLHRPGGLTGSTDLTNYPLNYQSDGPYTTMFRWFRANGAYQLEGAVIQRTDGQAFLPSDLRSLPWRTLVDGDVKDRLSDSELVQLMGDVVSEYGTDEARSNWPEDVHSQHQQTLITSSRRRYDDAHYEEVARLYDEAITAGSRAPNRWIADSLGVESTSTVKNWVVECRRRGLLPPTTERRAKGNSR
jgi:hypothetical protein